MMVLRSPRGEVLKKVLTNSSHMNDVTPVRQLGVVPFQSRVTKIVKRATDIVLASGMLMVFAPIMLLIGVLVRLKGNGAVFYRHTRVGKDGRKFGCLKFTTMVPNADVVLKRILAEDPEMREQWELAQKLPNDPRIIPGIGHLLRSSSLDELPQVFNVLLGHMSIVGPRPVTESELEKYGPYKNHYLSVKPGLTGPWQMGGRSDTTYAERVAKDVWYVENAGLVTDLRIFVKTVTSFVSGRLSGAC
ncbi:sugar transferase [Actibacterium sp. 188UL27-1]|uniref:sugar transferase n=1 Tax=Actibacterium sp. 188UL27-1 TaxID=2786961 RepID=UPI00195E07F3|nr:sugar transferase [Actibacterium sp. 188UL27-1]MBM7069110.1 sugar transferase [Actibacterium sp. 188UL27-1]